MPGVVALSWFRARVRRAIAPLVPRRDQHHKNLPNTTDMYRAVLPKPRTAISPATAKIRHMVTPRLRRRRASTSTPKAARQCVAPWPGLKIDPPARYDA